MSNPEILSESYRKILTTRVLFPKKKYSKLQIQISTFTILTVSLLFVDNSRQKSETLSLAQGGIFIFSLIYLILAWGCHVYN